MALVNARPRSRTDCAPSLPNFPLPGAAEPPGAALPPAFDATGADDPAGAAEPSGFADADAAELSGFAEAAADADAAGEGSFGLAFFRGGGSYFAACALAAFARPGNRGRGGEGASGEAESVAFAEAEADATGTGSALGRAVAAGLLAGAAGLLAGVAEAFDDGVAFALPEGAGLALSEGAWLGLSAAAAAAAVPPAVPSPSDTSIDVPAHRSAAGGSGAFVSAMRSTIGRAARSTPQCAKIEITRAYRMTVRTPHRSPRAPKKNGLRDPNAVASLPTTPSPLRGSPSRRRDARVAILTPRPLLAPEPPVSAPVSVLLPSRHSPSPALLQETSLVRPHLGFQRACVFDGHSETSGWLKWILANRLWTGQHKVNSFPSSPP